MSDHTPRPTGDDRATGRGILLQIPIRLLFTALASSTLQGRLHYTTADPYAVTVDVMRGTKTVATWVVARDLLDEGTRQPSGEGDFRVWPSWAPKGAGRSLFFSLDRPAGHATFEANLPVIRQWLDSTFEMVPAGSEGDLLDWDALEAGLLGSG
ncbi:SsgA family sporulation/cell division regulator [Streptomyces sp. NPDC006654]|uniref:SsgA family sporulation/cell division regulator n=1 Tax=Streptomyces sp. NPDC006654 TaxID=3156897 RepID=UPI0033CB16FC